MVETDSVDIIVELVDQFSDEIVKLRSELESLEEILDIYVIIHDDAEFAALEAKLEALDNKVIQKDFLFDFNDPETIGFRRIFGGSGFGPFEEAVDRSIADAAIQNPVDESTLQRLKRGFRRFGSRGSRAIGALEAGLEGADDGLRSLLPRWSTWVNLIAMMLPMLISLGAAAFGVAAAFGAIGLAGAGMLGLGLLGEGESMAQAFEQAQARLGEFKRDLFQTFRPLTREFQPFAEQFLGTAPNRLQPLVSALQDLTVFADEANDAFDGIVGWLSEAVTEMARFEHEIGVVADTFGPAIGSTIIGFLRTVVTEAYTNRETWVELGRVLVDVGLIIFNLSKALSFVAAELRPIFDLVAGLTNLLANEFIGKLGRSIVMVYGLAKALVAARAAVIALRNSLASTGVGLALIGAGMLASEYLFDPPKTPTYSAVPTGGGTGISNTYVFNVNGNPDPTALRRMEDIAVETGEQMNETKQDRKWPR